MSDFPSCTTQAEGGAEPHPHNFQLQQGLLPIWPFPLPGQPHGGGSSSAWGQMFGPGGQWMNPGGPPRMGPDPHAQFGPQHPPHPLSELPVRAMLFCTQCGLSYVFGLDGRWHKVEIGDPLRPEQPE